MPQSLAKNYIHLVFSTKNRHPFLSDAIRQELHAYIAAVLRKLNSPTVEINSVEDHIHLLFDLHRTLALSQAVEDVKKSSSKWLKTQQEGLALFSWQAGYGAFSVSQSNVESVSTYIRNQQEHHRNKTFQEELRTFLQRHHLEFDERYLWD